MALYLHNFYNGIHINYVKVSFNKDSLVINAGNKTACQGILRGRNNGFLCAFT